jgi:TatA/E family protein of Tat protein translocase
LPGFADLLLILFVVLIIFGASKLPAIATSMGRAIERMRNKSGDTGEDDPSRDEQ